MGWGGVVGLTRRRPSYRWNITNNTTNSGTTVKNTQKYVGPTVGVETVMVRPSHLHLFDVGCVLGLLLLVLGFLRDLLLLDQLQGHSGIGRLV